MDALVIEGPVKLKGSVRVSGSKNTALPLLFTSLLFDKEIRFENVPRLWDIETTLKLLEEMGAETAWDKDASAITIFPKITNAVASYELVKRMRAGILALGPLVAKNGEAKVSLPGGCAIGARPVNYHIEAMRKMGVAVEMKDGYIHATVPKRLVGAHIVFPQVTVTGTENILIVAAVAEGETIIENAACEPEVTELGEVLQRAGADVVGLGSPTIKVRGTKLRDPGVIRIPADRIEAGTWIAGAVATRSELTITDADAEKMGAVIEAFRGMGAKLDVSSDNSTIKVTPAEKYSPLEIETKPYPGFATDMQAQIMTALLQASGASTIRETIFENRFMHVAELQRLGAKISIHDSVAIVEGPTKLRGAPIMATDLRASASLVLAALCAEGQTKVSRIYHLDRGYQRLDEKLRQLGVKITRIKEDLV